MERMTSRNEDCVLVNGHALGCATVGEIVQMADRLADYEDAGLTPAEVLSMHSEWSAMMSVLNSIGSYGRLRELAEADKDGRVLFLPCKVGDTVYTLEHVVDRDRTHCEIIPRKITGIGGNTLNKVWLVSAKSDYEVRISPSEFGILAFLTREEAEKALAEMKGETEK